MSRPFNIVDVFGDGDFTGNPLAVVAVAEGLAADEMLAICRWLGFSETTFLLAPTDSEADYAVRIFTPAHELPFAGHPTLGSAHAWAALGGVAQTPGRIVQQCGAGLVPVDGGEGRYAFRAPPLLRDGPVDPADLAAAAALLGIDPTAIVDAAWASNGPGWMAILLASADAVLALRPAQAHDRYAAIGVIGAHPAGHAAAFEIRTFFTDQHLAVREDPVTGSFNAAAAQWLFASGRADADYVAAQGTMLGRRGRVTVTRDAGGDVWVGGATRTLFSGTTGG